MENFLSGLAITFAILKLKQLSLYSKVLLSYFGWIADHSRSLIIPMAVSDISRIEDILGFTNEQVIEALFELDKLGALKWTPSKYVEVLV